jgi:hypothetical protein
MSAATSHTEIPDELIEKAARAIAPGWWDESQGDELIEVFCATYRQYARAALEAVAPSLRAQGMREAADVAATVAEKAWRPEIGHATRAILARANQLEQQQEADNAP